MQELMSASANDKLSRITVRLESRPLQPLAPKRVWDRELDDEIASLTAEFGAARARKESVALMAGLHLRNDSLDRSHTYAQEIEDDPTGGYWHGIIHRMEGDYWNANYWFREAGRHPAMEKLYTRAADYLRHEVQHEALPDGSFRDHLRSLAEQGAWNAFTFTKLVEAFHSGRAPEEARELLEHIQYIEISELFAYTLGAAGK
jgi:hypothetical protein